jgi:hypothetical protein
MEGNSEINERYKEDNELQVRKRFGGMEEEK